MNQEEFLKTKKRIDKLTQEVASKKAVLAHLVEEANEAKRGLEKLLGCKPSDFKERLAEMREELEEETQRAQNLMDELEESLDD